MKSATTWSVLLVAALTTAPAGADERVLLEGVRQLTFEGRRSGEGYFDRSGNLMVFQSEREADNPFYQIYLMDLETGDVERISPGHGKTTCAWIHPDRRHVLYASTHDNPEARAQQQAELEFRASGKERRYSWDYDEHFELYLADRQGQTRRLTDVRGYDAEGAISPDGEWVVFSSNRAAYEAPLSAEDARTFERDKSFMLDLYRMRLDGSDLQRLTDVRGYDGGPFFSHDGKKICWRRFSEDGATAEVFTMNADGSDQRQLTTLGAMSWAPFFHPSGEYLIFTTNKHGFANFELYLVGKDGGPPVRVTYTDGFDGLPCFGPDGNTLSWTSNRTSGKQSQIFLARWNHSAALRLLKEARSGAADATTQVENPIRPVDPHATGFQPEISERDLRRHIATLASEEFAGRMTGTAGEQAATAYVADAFRQIGLQPAGDNGTFFENFSFTAGVEVDPTSRLTVTHDGTAWPDEALGLNTDWRPLTWSATGPAPQGGLVWAGYGIVAPADKGFDEYDSYVHLDVQDKWVCVLRYMPEGITPEHRQHLSRYSSLRYKAMMLRDKGAAGMIVVSGPNSGVKQQLVPIRFDASAAAGSLPVISITDALATALLCPDDRDCDRLRSLQDALDDGSPQMGFELPLAVQATIELKREQRTGRNVLALLPARPASDEPALVIGGHVDHLGHGSGSNSLARDDEKGAIHYGADDNASGVAATLEIAAWLADQQRRGKLALKRDVLFAAWSGEELGLLGSAHFVDQRAAAGHSNDLSGRFAAYLNMDMVGRYRDELVLNGVGSSSIWKREIERRNAPIGLQLALKDDSYLPTDATSFYLKSVPILSAFTGSHEDYHSPRDTPDKLNYEGTHRIARFVGLIARALATTTDEPDYLEPTKPREQSARAGLRAYLGTIPDYGESEIPGLKISGVAQGGPADEAGLQGGDVIVELAGRTIENIYDYTYAIDAVKIGQKTSITVVRDGARKELQITPGSRE